MELVSELWSRLTGQPWTSPFCSLCLSPSSVEANGCSPAEVTNCSTHGGQVAMPVTARGKLGWVGGTGGSGVGEGVNWRVQVIVGLPPSSSQLSPEGIWAQSALTFLFQMDLKPFKNPSKPV